MNIRNQFKQYMQRLGFSDVQIIKAWEKSLTHSNSPDPFIAEVITRDILQGKADYLEEKN